MFFNIVNVIIVNVICVETLKIHPSCFQF